MKKQPLSPELVERTVEALDEVENAVLGVQTGVKSGAAACDPATCHRALYGIGDS